MTRLEKWVLIPRVNSGALACRRLYALRFTRYAERPDQLFNGVPPDVQARVRIFLRYYQTVTVAATTIRVNLNE